jgi:hypothetical protein
MQSDPIDRRLVPSLERIADNVGAVSDGAPLRPQQANHSGNIAPGCVARA